MNSRRTLLLALLVLYTSASQAISMRFLQDSVLNEFGKDDVVLFKKFVRESLETVEDGAIAEWQSPHSDLKGKLKPKFSFQTNGIQCRRTAFLVAKAKYREQYIFDVCRLDNRWEIMPTPVASFGKSDWDRLRASATEALNQDIDGTAISWFNPKTKNSGVLVALAIERAEVGVCRNLAISILDKRGRSSNATYRFCKDSGGEWSRKIENY